MITLYNFYIFDKRGGCLFCHEWYRPHNPLADNPDEDTKLVFGLLFSFKQLCQKLEPEVGTEFNKGGNVNSFSTNSFTLHQLETPSGLRFVLNTSTCTTHVLKDIKLALKHVYSELFVPLIVKNPLYKPGSKIESEIFEKQFDRYMNGMIKRLAN